MRSNKILRWRRRCSNFGRSSFYIFGFVQAFVGQTDVTMASTCTLYAPLTPDPPGLKTVISVLKHQARPVRHMTSRLNQGSRTCAKYIHSLPAVLVCCTFFLHTASGYPIYATTPLRLVFFLLSFMSFLTANPLSLISANPIHPSHIPQSRPSTLHRGMRIAQI